AARMAVEWEVARLAAEREGARVAAEQEAARMAAELEAELEAAEVAAAQEAARAEAARIAAEHEVTRVATEREVARVAAEAARVAEELERARVAVDELEAMETARPAAEAAPVPDEPEAPAAAATEVRTSRVAPDPTRSTRAARGDAESKAIAFLSAGAVYVCNDGGFLWSERAGINIPMDLATGSNQPPDFEGGWIERVDLGSGAVTRLYSECDGHRLRSPNDIVFDASGGFWFTDLGKQRARDV